MAGLSEHEKEQCRFHLGYPETTFGEEQAAAGIQFGMARPVQTAFILELAIGSLLTNAYAVDRVRKMLCTLEDIQQKMLCATGQLGVARVGDIELRGAKAGETHTDLLEREYDRWKNRLADALGVPLYPYSTRNRRGRGSFRVI